jgi:hypothetical protein
MNYDERVRAIRDGFARANGQLIAETFPALEPPESTSKVEAIGGLRGSGETFARAVETVTLDRCASCAIQMPFGPLFSLYEVGEFTAAHVHRHIGQLRRTVGGTQP